MLSKVKKTPILLLRYYPIVLLGVVVLFFGLQYICTNFMNKRDEYGLTMPRNFTSREMVALPKTTTVKYHGPHSPVPSPQIFNDILTNAEKGDAESLLYMGVFFANGDIVKQVYAKAAEWYRKAAEKGNARAQRNLAVLYDCGLGVARDYAEALKWYMRAVEQGDAAAHLGMSGFPFTYRYSIYPIWWTGVDSWRAKACFLVWEEYVKVNGLDKG